MTDTRVLSLRIAGWRPPEPAAGAGRRHSRVPPDDTGVRVERRVPRWPVGSGAPLIAAYRAEMGDPWPAGDERVLTLPSGRRIRGRGLGRPLPEGLRPEFAVYLLGHQPDPVDWPARWVVWPDFRLPKDRADATDAFAEAWRRSEHERVEVACHGGHGRTGTALACVAVLDGVPAAQAVAFVRQHYDSHAVETPWQSRFVRQFA